MWIEIYSYGQVADRSSVTPLAGVWIEISVAQCFEGAERVTPLAGVWIEIHFRLCTMAQGQKGHSPRGSVD